MIVEEEAEITDEQATIIIRYLAETYPKVDAGEPAPAKPEPPPPAAEPPADAKPPEPQEEKGA